MILAQAAARGGARHHLLWVLLALSLALNLCFVAGAVWTRFHAPPPPIAAAERLRQMADTLGLDAPQRAAFERYSQTMRERLESMRQTVRPLVREAWSEVAKPQANETKVMQLLDQAAQKRRGIVRELTTTTLSFLSILSPEQRAKFVELAHQRPRPWSPPGDHPSH